LSFEAAEVTEEKQQRKTGLSRTEFTEITENEKHLRICRCSLGILGENSSHRVALSAK
jgi:hypothetical protein